MKTMHLAAGAVAALAALGATRGAHAQNQNTEIVTQPAPVAPAAEQTAYTGPNRALISSGILTFGLSYIPSVVVAAESSRSADHHLYVPVVGPWLDLGDRPGCGAGSIACDTETTNKVLLVADGIFQGLGVVTTVVGFLVPERAEVVTTTAQNDKPSLHLTPAQFGSSGYGLAAFGRF